MEVEASGGAFCAEAEGMNWLNKMRVCWCPAATREGLRSAPPHRLIKAAPHSALFAWLLTLERKLITLERKPLSLQQCLRAQRARLPSASRPRRTSQPARPALGRPPFEPSPAQQTTHPVGRSSTGTLRRGKDDHHRLLRTDEGRGAKCFLRFGLLLDHAKPSASSVRPRRRRGALAPRWFGADRIGSSGVGRRVGVGGAGPAGKAGGRARGARPARGELGRS